MFQSTLSVLMQNEIHLFGSSNLTSRICWTRPLKPDIRTVTM